MCGCCTGRERFRTICARWRRRLCSSSTMPATSFRGGEVLAKGYEWPENEHGLHVDHRGFVWIVGNAIPQDGQILKFTKAGRFVAQIGKSGQTGGNTTPFLRGAAGLRVHPKTNELFVSDGYGNSRVMVYDAQTGRLQDACGAPTAENLSIRRRSNSASRRRRPRRCRRVSPRRFSISRRSMTSTCRTTASCTSLIAETSASRCSRSTARISRSSSSASTSPEYQQARSTAFSHDAEQRFLYVAGSPVIYILDRRTLQPLGEFVIGISAGESARPSDRVRSVRQSLRAAGVADRP